MAGAIVLTLLRQADEQAAIKAVPWGVIVMVCGVTVLAALLEKTGGIDRFTTLVAQISNTQSVTGVVALLTGLVSIYSSTSGVVLPAFLPIVPGLVEQLGGGDPGAIASSMVIGGNLVDVSPLSTIGALCISGVTSGADRRMLFNQVLAWGLSMSVAAAIVCYLYFSVL
jgi:di/tricarboxylate transporter